MTDGLPKRDAARTSLLTVAEVAETLRLSRMTVYRLVHSGELPAVRVGRSFRVPQSAVDDLLTQTYQSDDTDTAGRASG